MNFNGIKTEEEFSQFIDEYPDDPYYLIEMLHFWVTHPCAQFNKLAIIHALDSRQIYTEKALHYLVNKGVLRGKVKNEISLYSLTEEKSMRDLVLNMVKSNLSQYQPALG